MSAWEAIVVDGRERDLRAFVAGFAGDRGIDPNEIVLGDDVGLEAGSAGEWLLDLIGKGHHVLLAPDTLAGTLADAIRRGGDEIGLSVERTHAVSGARFDVRAEAFSREVASALRSVIDSPPPGVRLESRQESEHSLGEEHHVDLYDRVHHYTYELSVRVVGPIAGVLGVRRRLAEIEVATLEPLHLTE